MLTKVGRVAAASHSIAREILSAGCPTDQPEFHRPRPALDVQVVPSPGWQVWHEMSPLSSFRDGPQRRKCAVLLLGRAEAEHSQAKSSIHVRTRS